MPFQGTPKLTALNETNAMWGEFRYAREQIRSATGQQSIFTQLVTGFLLPRGIRERSARTSGTGALRLQGAAATRIAKQRGVRPSTWLLPYWYNWRMIVLLFLFPKN